MSGLRPNVAACLHSLYELVHGCNCRSHALHTCLSQKTFPHLHSTRKEWYISILRQAHTPNKDTVYTTPPPSQTCTELHLIAPYLTCDRQCHHPESITGITLKCVSHSCHIDVVLCVGIQPVQDHIPLALPVTDLVLLRRSLLVVHL